MQPHSFGENAYFDSTHEDQKRDEGFRILDNLKIIHSESDGHVTKEGGYFKFNDFILTTFLQPHKANILDVVLI